MVSKKYTAASSRSEPHELKVWAVISHADMSIERNVNPLTALNRATAVGFDLPMRSDGPSITAYRVKGHLVPPRPPSSSLESSKLDTKTNTKSSVVLVFAPPPPYSRIPRNGRACLPRGSRVEIRQKPAPRIGAPQQAKTKPTAALLMEWAPSRRVDV